MRFASPAPNRKPTMARLTHMSGRIGHATAAPLHPVFTQEPVARNSESDCHICDTWCLSHPSDQVDAEIENRF